jgi:hypothetical protein
VITKTALLSWGSNIRCNPSRTEDLILYHKILLNNTNFGAVLSIASSLDHTLLLTETGLHGCGSNDHGQLGTGQTQTTPQPLTKVNALPYTNGYIQIAASEQKSASVVEYTCKELNLCSGEQHGVCIAPNICLCEKGRYAGPQCQYFMCHGHVHEMNGTVCSGHGSCVGPDLCRCARGYKGNQCELPYTCYGKKSSNSSVCSGHGVCVAEDKCECLQEYYTSDCSYNIGDEKMAGILAIVGISVGSLVLLLIILVIIIVCVRKKQRKELAKSSSPHIDDEEFFDEAMDEELVIRKEKTV